MRTRPLALLSAILLSSCTTDTGPTRFLSEETSPPLRDGDWTRCLLLDFGRRDERVAGALAVSRTFRYHEAGWEGGMARNGINPGIGDLYCRDFIEGENTTLVLGVQPAETYRIVLSLGDQARPRGPMTIRVNDRPIAQGLRTRPGELRNLKEEIRAADGLIRVQFRTDDCGSFAAVGLALYVPPGVASPDTGTGMIRSIYPREHVAYRPGTPITEATARPRALESLREQAEFLLAKSPQEGGFSYTGNWYENAYPIRMLLAAGTLLENPEYAARAYEVLDRFIAEQREDGNWSSQYFGGAGCPLAMQTARSGTSSNLADVGVMAAALTLASATGTPERREAYLQAARRYADGVVLPNQLESGGFPNLTYRGVEYRGVYSVATATQAMHLAVLHRATGDRRYLEGAQRAADFLASQCRTGECTFFPHDTALAETLTADRIGDLFYIAEGLLVTARVAEAPYRERIEASAHALLGGPRGIFARAAEDAWWVFENLWEQSKRAGLLYLVSLYRSLEGASGWAPLSDRLLACLSDPGCSEWFGVGALPYSPDGQYGMVTTGFAGLGLAAAVEPASLRPLALVFSPAGSAADASAKGLDPTPRD